MVIYYGYLLEIPDESDDFHMFPSSRPGRSGPNPMSDRPDRPDRPAVPPVPRG